MSCRPPAGGVLRLLEKRDGVGSETDLGSSHQEDYAVQARIAPSVQIEAEIERLLLDGLEGGGDTDASNG